jgi:dienelactone hydrolase
MNTAKLPLAFTMLFLASLACAAQQPGSDSEPALARGAVVNSVPCVDHPGQSYALYLPSQYSPDRRWPIIYAFDPAARGSVPVELYKDAAEKYGYIVVGSNNAKNGPSAPEMEAAQAIWQDTHRRFAINKDRVYVTGLSGGARFATSFALYCYTCGIAGVIAHGAGYPGSETVHPANDHFLYYAVVGDEDFNLPELLALRKKKEEQHAAFKLNIYSGPHQWAPKDVVQDAIQWLELKTMQAGTEKPDPAFIRAMLEKTRAQAAEAAQQGRSMDQFYALRSLVDDFKGLQDVAPFESQIADLKNSKALKKAEREEAEEIDKQHRLTATPAAELSELGQLAGSEQSRLKLQLESLFSDLRRQAKSSDREHKLYQRAFSQLWLQGIETGQSEFRNNQASQAAVYFELMAEVAPDQAGPLVLLAETQVRVGNRKAALKALEEAVRRGLKHADTLTHDAELAPLASDPEFQKIVQSLQGS